MASRGPRNASSRCWVALARDEVNTEVVIDMRFSMQTGRKVWLELLCAAALLLPSPAMGQQSEDPTASEAQTQPATATQPAVPQPSLSVSELQLHLKQVQDATDLAEDTKSKALSLYTQAIQQLEIAEQWAAKAPEYEAERQKAPETLSAIQAELMTPLGDQTGLAVDDLQRTLLARRDALPTAVAQLLVDRHDFPQHLGVLHRSGIRLARIACSRE